MFDIRNTAVTIIKLTVARESKLFEPLRAFLHILFIEPLLKLGCVDIPVD